MAKCACAASRYLVLPLSNPTHFARNHAMKLRYAAVLGWLAFASASSVADIFTAPPRPAVVGWAESQRASSGPFCVHRCGFRMQARPCRHDCPRLRFCPCFSARPLSFAGHLSWRQRGADDPCQQPRQLGPSVPAAGPRTLAWLHGHRPGLSLLPVCRGQRAGAGHAGAARRHLLAACAAPYGTHLCHRPVPERRAFCALERRR